MLPLIAPAPAPTPAAAPSPSAAHQYDTRTRSSAGIKPSIRLRQSPDAPLPPRRAKPSVAPKPKQVAGPSTPAVAQTPLMPFPPSHVILHPDDAGNKVFLAMGRALMSVDNRAMTVKDLSELGMKYGLACQNMSAAGQAITTFIRNHLSRCEIQQDQPLLLRHVMSGTIADDDLVPALYSRAGGAHCSHPDSEGRLTNFRRGTMVWYLSKAAGGPCPFSRSGIRLCDYNENGKIGVTLALGREKKRERDRMRKAAQTVGQKRKRLLRSCADHGSDSESESSDEDEKRPPKVKLTLKLKPSLTPTPGASDSAPTESRAASPQPSDMEDTDDSDSDSDDSDSSMSVDSDSEESPAASPTSHLPATDSADNSEHARIPSPLSSGYLSYSVPHHTAWSVPGPVPPESPPPDSEDEDDDFHITMTGARRSSEGRLHTPFEDEDSSWEDDFFGDADVETETQWESPGPRSPSAQLEDDIVVKQEPADAGGLFDAWDDLNSTAEGLKVIDVVAQAAAAERQAEQSTSGDLDAWGWPSLHPDSPYIKQEEFETGLFPVHDPMQPEALSPMASLDICGSPVEEQPLHAYKADPYYTLQWRDVEILCPDSVKPHDLDAGAWREYRGARAASPEERVQSSSPAPSIVPTASPPVSPTLSRGALALDVPPAGPSLVPERHLSVTSPTLLASLTSLSLQTPSSSAATPSSSLTTAPQAAAPCPSEAQVPAVLPLHPLALPVSAVELEGVAVYQAILGSSTLLRRVDTDFVNLSLICQHLNVPVPCVSGAATITIGSTLVRGTWVPLEVARDVAKDEMQLRPFLSDDLRSQFPDAIDALCSIGDHSTAHPAFGHQFKSASEERRQSMASHRLELPPREKEESWDSHLSTHPFFAFPTTAIDGERPTPEIPAVAETPLSPTEEAMFHVLCAAPEWDTTTEAAMEDAEDDATMRLSIDGMDSGQERALRRSKRAATVATRSRTRSTKRGSRTSLS